MQIIDNILYIEHAEAISSGINERTLAMAKLRNSNVWRFIDDPADRRKVLIEYERMQPRYKEMIQKRFGNVYEYVAKQPIRNMVRRDEKAHEFYLQYRFDGDKFLPIDTVEKYTVAASWLNMLAEVGEDKRTLKQLLRLSIGEFWLKVFEILLSDGIELPKTYRRLTEKLKQYKKDGYATLIHSSFGNKSALKVSTETAQAMLLEMIAHPNQHDDVWIALAYNKWANKNGVKEIHPATVGNWRRDNEQLIIAQRCGNNAFNEKYIRQVKGLRPSGPLYMVEHDDNNLDFLFTNTDDVTQAKYYNKYVAICVVDSSCDLLLGKSYIQSANPKKWMVRHAYIDAMYYIRSITGGWYLPFEIKSDRWASADLYPYYKKIGDFIPTKKGNKHNGYREAFFGRPLWKRAQKIGASNWTGNNISAKYRGVNTEVLDINKSIRPRVGDEAEYQIENFFHRLRHMPDVTRKNFNSALSKEQQWLAKWNDMREDQKRPISDLQFLSIFGITHNPDRPITITNRGIEPQICNIKHSFDLPADLQLSHFVGAKVNVIYDPYDMSRVMVTNNDDIRFIARSATFQPRALQDQYTGSRTYLNAILAEKKEQVEVVSKAEQTRKRIINFDGIDTEAVLMSGIVNKELKNQAEEAYLLPVNSTFLDTNTEDYDPLDDM